MRISRLICSTSPDAAHATASPFRPAPSLVKTVPGRDKDRARQRYPTSCARVLTAESVPHRRSSRATWAYDTTHLGDGALRIGYEIKHEHREGPIEKVVTERQFSCVGLLEHDAPVGVASARSFRITSSQIDRRLRPRSFVRSWRIRNTHLRQNRRQGRLPMPSVL
jgi:hypothetical protein